jgi:flagellar hook assembly protein FlgD
VDIVVSKNENAGGTGTLYVKNFEGISNSLEKTRTNKLIKSIEVRNASFSPNNDGVADNVYFTYILLQNADVEFVVYDMAGDEVYDEDFDSRSANTQYTITWNGKDSGGHRIKNGLYFYKLSAKNDDKDDSITHVVGVFR